MCCHRIEGTLWVVILVVLIEYSFSLDPITFDLQKIPSYMVEGRITL